MYIDTVLGASLTPSDVEKAYCSRLVPRKRGLRFESRFQEKPGSKLPVDGIHGLKGG